MNGVEISVIIPTCHRNDCLAACLRRLAPGVQSFAGNVEVVVTDDGLRQTAEQLIAEKFSWARWTPGPRRGPAANRNHGAKVASGQWLIFTDDDCLPAFEWLEGYAKAIARSNGPVLEGRTTCEAGLRPLLDEAPVNLEGGNLWSCNMAVSREVFERIGQFDVRFSGANAEDLEFHDRLRRAKVPVHFIPEAVVDHPPRRRRRGVTAGRLWEGRALLKSMDPNTLRGSMPLHVAKVRASQMLKTQPSFDWVDFAWSSALEVATVCILYRMWLRRYAGQHPIAPHLEHVAAPQRNEESEY